MTSLPASALLAALARVSGVRSARAVSPCVVRFESRDALLGWVPAAVAVALRADGSVVDACPAAGGRSCFPSVVVWLDFLFG